MIMKEKIISLGVEIERYDFKDELGHKLIGCVQYRELLRLAMIGYIIEDEDISQIVYSIEELRRSEEVQDGGEREVVKKYAKEPRN